MFRKPKSLYRRISRRVLPWIGGCALVLGIVDMVAIPRYEWDPGFLTLNFLVGFYFVYCAFAISLYARRSYRKDQRFQHDFVAEITNEGIDLTTASAEASMQWASIIRSLESDRLFVLFHAERIFNTIPKRAFEPADVDRFRELLHQKVADSE